MFQKYSLLGNAALYKYVITYDVYVFIWANLSDRNYVTTEGHLHVKKKKHFLQ